ncbi:AcrR family transcriptional regulator [Paenibacillus sp. V4I3]|uniref:TetR/AcrR family transcriptional regulator n=1 Tax=Paenibacillus sp. V4I3 TaxID=3042305 RepID=UPI0027897B4A|nr:TetR/AcrR family transcriptional regulator [Paenibacillus sp. V4I3]MDQ0871715.1 AcrR family transcriptional regulator [Paenibacillus sp. V4I3]
MASNKDRIMEAAMDLFHDHGFQGTGLEDILTSSGVCKSNFYYHFKSEDELGLKVIERKVQEMRQSVMEPSLGNAQLTPKQCCWPCLNACWPFVRRMNAAEAASSVIWPWS